MGNQPNSVSFFMDSQNSFIDFLVKSFQCCVYNFEENLSLEVNVNSCRILTSECCCVYMAYIQFWIWRNIVVEQKTRKIEVPSPFIAYLCWHCLQRSGAQESYRRQYYTFLFFLRWNCTLKDSHWSLHSLLNLFGSNPVNNLNGVFLT